MDPRIVRGLIALAAAAIYVVADSSATDIGEIVKQLQLVGVMLGWATLRRPGDSS